VRSGAVAASTTTHNPARQIRQPLMSQLVRRLTLQAAKSRAIVFFVNRFRRNGPAPTRATRWRPKAPDPDSFFW
jgi:hypothetical protein